MHLFCYVAVVPEFVSVVIPEVAVLDAPYPPSVPATVYGPPVTERIFIAAPPAPELPELPPVVQREYRICKNVAI